MEIMKVKLIERIKRTNSVESFRFQPYHPIEFMPGQFAQILFDPRNKNNQNLNKYLSFCNSPARDCIEVTKRLSDSLFSSRLRELAIGDEVTIKAPLGNCVFKDEYKKIIFLIGGIGITPVISIIEYIVDKKLDTQVNLFYSNRNEGDIAFKNELDAWQTKHANIKVTYTVTGCKPQDALCLFGEINQTMVQEMIADIPEQVFFIFGPPGMVLAMKHVCAKIGCDEDNLKTETFVGY